MMKGIIFVSAILILEVRGVSACTIPIIFKGLILQNMSLVG